MAKKFFLVTIISIIFGIASSMKDSSTSIYSSMNLMNLKRISTNSRQFFNTFCIQSNFSFRPKCEENLNSLNNESIESNRDVSNDSKILLHKAILNKLRKKRRTNGTSIKPNYCSKVYCKVTSCNYFKGILYQLCKKCVYNDKYCISEGSDVF